MQTDFKLKLTEAVAGMLGTASGDPMSMESRHNENVSTDDFPNMAMGVLVAEGTEEDGALNLAAQADKLAGVVVRSQAQEPGVNVDAETGDVLENQSLTVLRRGQVWVQIEETVAAGDPVRYRAVADPDTGEQAGIFRTTDPTGTDTVLITEGARWVRGGVASGSPTRGIALLEIDILNLAVTADS